VSGKSPRWRDRQQRANPTPPRRASRIHEILLRPPRVIVVFWGGGQPGHHVGFARKARKPPEPGRLPRAGSRPRSGVGGERRRAARAPIAPGNRRPDPRRTRARARLRQLQAGERLLRRGEPNLARLHRDLGPAARGSWMNSPLAYIEEGETVGSLRCSPAASATATVGAGKSLHTFSMLDGETFWWLASLARVLGRPAGASRKALALEQRRRAGEHRPAQAIRAGGPERSPHRLPQPALARPALPRIVQRHLTLPSPCASR